STFIANAPGTSVYDLAFDHSGNLFVSVAGSANRIEKYSPVGADLGTVVNFINGAGPAGIAFDGTGNLYAADSGLQRVYAISGSSYTTFASSGLGGEYYGIAFSPTTGELYVANASNNTIERFSAG